jgi:hypothetical protein
MENGQQTRVPRRGKTAAAYGSAAASNGTVTAVAAVTGQELYQMKGRGNDIYIHTLDHIKRNWILNSCSQRWPSIPRGYQFRFGGFSLHAIYSTSTAFDNMFRYCAPISISILGRQIY